MRLVIETDQVISELNIKFTGEAAECNVVSDSVNNHSELVKTAGSTPKFDSIEKKSSNNVNLDDEIPDIKSREESIDTNFANQTF